MILQNLTRLANLLSKHGNDSWLTLEKVPCLNYVMQRMLRGEGAVMKKSRPQTTLTIDESTESKMEYNVSAALMSNQLNDHESVSSSCAIYNFLKCILAD